MERHIHVLTVIYREFQHNDNMVVTVKVQGERNLVFANVKLLVPDNEKFEMHIDSDEAADAGIYRIGEGIFNICFPFCLRGDNS